MTERKHSPQGGLPAALRSLAQRLGGAFGGLSTAARARLAAACDAFADLIEQGEAGSVRLRALPLFLLSAMFSIDLAPAHVALSEADEAWLVAEVEAELAVARRLREGADA